MITIFFRKARKGAFSIENLFKNFTDKFPESLNYKLKYLPLEGASPRKILLNGLFALRNQTEINHISGEVYYLALFLQKKSLLLTYHDLRLLETLKGLKGKIFKLLYFHWPIMRANQITCISEVTRQELIAQFPISRNKTRVIPNCISSDFTFEPKFSFPQKPIILLIGTKENKNVERVFQAMDKLACKIVIVGQLTTYQRDLAVKLNLDIQNEVDVSHSRIVELYKYCDLLSFVSLKEGFGMPIVEAQATGRPVLTSNCSSMPEVGGDGALYVDPYNVQEIRKGLISLINNKELRDNLVQLGYKNVKRFSAQTIADQYAELYKTMASS